MEQDDEGVSTFQTAIVRVFGAPVGRRKLTECCPAKLASGEIFAMMALRYAQVALHYAMSPPDSFEGK